MNLSQLRYFAAVAQFEHYGKAANALFITQPALSNAISRLEKELGFTLFENVGRNVTLTQSGKRLYKSVSKALAELDHGIAEARQEDEANNPPLGSDQLQRFSGDLFLTCSTISTKALNHP